jgi:hypothetical protein
VEVEMPAGSLELPLPDDTEAMIVESNEIVEAAIKNINSESLKQAIKGQYCYYRLEVLLLNKGAAVSIIIWKCCLFGSVVIV